jgi:hypothetical protein
MYCGARFTIDLYANIEWELCAREFWATFYSCRVCI